MAVMGQEATQRDRPLGHVEAVGTEHHLALMSMFNTFALFLARQCCNPVAGISDPDALAPPKAATCGFGSSLFL